MIKNYFKIAVRNVIKNKYYFIVNVLGLTLSLLCCILIMLWIQDELSYDTYHENSENIYRIVNEGVVAGKKSFTPQTSPMLAGKIQSELAEVINTSRYYENDIPVKNGSSSMGNKRLSFIDPSFLEMFTLNFIHGNSQSALTEPNSVIVTEKIAGQLFGSENPIGKVIEMGDKYNLKITGVVADQPGNSSFRFSLLAPFELLKQSRDDLNDWSYDEFLTFVQLKPGVSVRDVQEKLNASIHKEFPEKKNNYNLQPLTDIRLYSSEITHDPMKHGEIKYVNIFIIAALLMLAIACMNFINLTTAYSFTRLKEIGVRQTIGAERKNLIFQFICESLLIFLVSLVISVGMVQFGLPSFNNFIGKDLILFSINNLPVFLILIGITLFSCIISSYYPALAITKSKRMVTAQFPIDQIGSRISLRKVLVIGQFVLGVFFIIAMITINRQNNYMQTKDLGFDKEHLLYIPFQIREDSESSYNLIKNELLKNPGIKDVSMANNILTGMYSSSSKINWEGKNPNDKTAAFICTCAFGFIETSGMKLLEGRSFSPEYPADINKSIILNRKAAGMFNLKSPVGKNISFRGDRTVIGVVEDFHFKSLYQKVEPMVMVVDPVCRYIFIRIESKNVASTINNLASVWKKNLPDRPFNINFLDDTINQQYKSEQQLGWIINCFAVFAIIISCLGLFGLVFFMTERRKKEIGIRKVLGASVASIVFMLTKDFTKWIIIGIMIAFPLAYYSMHKWLQDFAYKIEMDWWVFAASGGIALLIALSTVSSRAFKAASSDPVKSIRYE